VVIPSSSCSSEDEALSTSNKILDAPEIVPPAPASPSISEHANLSSSAASKLVCKQ